MPKRPTEGGPSPLTLDPEQRHDGTVWASGLSGCDENDGDTQKAKKANGVMVLNVSEQSPLVKRLSAFMVERFPPFQPFGVFPLYLAVVESGKALTGMPPRLLLQDFLGFAAFVALFLMLRVIDDHIDFDHDSAHYPERVLQRDLVTLRHLAVIGGVCFVVQLVVSLFVDHGFGKVTRWWVVLVAVIALHSWITSRVRPIHAWLYERRVIYALTFLPTVALIALWIAQLGAGGRPLPGTTAWLVGFYALSAEVVEVGRKSRTPEDERPTVVDYTKPSSSWTRSFGLRGTVAVLVVLGAATALIAGALLHELGSGSRMAYGLLVATQVLPLAASLRFADGPSRLRAKTVATSALVACLLVQLVVGVTLAAGR